MFKGRSFRHSVFRSGEPYLNMVNVCKILVLQLSYYFYSPVDMNIALSIATLFA